MMMPPLLPEAFAVARGSHLPRHSAAAYRAAALAWAESGALPNESQTVALARAVTGGCEVVDIFYRAAAISHALETLDLSELVPTDAPDAANRLSAWASLLELVEPNRAPGERLRDTVRRLLSDNVAARALYLLILIQEPGPKQ
ncbi:MAG TPA: hypothetical protein VJP77_09790 [Planctomycetota bacterium]|nr:hypothetical protein [Planctomycetota bacterium]